ncbi:MAG: DUF1549 domain-containing protein, partial [Planctomycetales bacterium]|nr:DUF1549 domain-containing protein [Planctomycetales bacterium]
MIRMSLARPTSRLARLLILVALTLTATTASAQEALHERIDGLMQRQWGPAPMPVASDEEFIRRIYLDLIGQVPPIEDVRAFLDDSATDKRSQLVDRLLDDPRHARHLATWFDVASMERRPKKHIEQADWLKYLNTSFSNDKPLDQLSIEILSADGADENLRPAAKFLLARDVDAHLLTRDIGRVFLGVDLQCAQCHNHPHIDSYYQEDYYGIYAGLLRSAPLAIDDVTYVAEKADGGFEFTSAFTGDSGQAEMRLPDGWPILDSPVPTDQPYAVAPADKVRHVPRWSRRAAFAEAMVHSSDRMFAQNWANRLWALMLGRGIVHPLDLHHADNPPTYPELLAALTDGLIEHEYRIKPFLREIALSQAYQRPFDIETLLQADAAAPALQEVAAVSLEPLEELELATRSARNFARKELFEANQAQLTHVGALLAARGQVETLTGQIQSLEATATSQRAQVAQWEAIQNQLNAAATDLGVTPEEVSLAIFAARLATAAEGLAATEASLATSRQT